jgi:hypothetical protein
MILLSDYICVHIYIYLSCCITRSCVVQVGDVSKIQTKYKHLTLRSIMVGDLVLIMEFSDHRSLVGLTRLKMHISNYEVCLWHFKLTWCHSLCIWGWQNSDQILLSLEYLRDARYSKWIKLAKNIFPAFGLVVGIQSSCYQISFLKAWKILCVHASWWMGATSLWLTWKPHLAHYFLENSWWVGNMEAKLLLHLIS